MPWNEVTPMEEINRFVCLAAAGRLTLTELCGPSKVRTGAPSNVLYFRQLTVPTVLKTGF